MSELEELREDSRQMLAELRSHDRGYNCHEYAFKLDHMLEEQDWSTRRIHGIAEYDVEFVLNYHFQGSDLDIQDCLQDVEGSFTVPHSWVEVHGEETYVVDTSNFLELERISVDEFPLIDRKRVISEGIRYLERGFDFSFLGNDFLFLSSSVYSTGRGEAIVPVPDLKMIRQ